MSDWSGTLPTILGGSVPDGTDWATVLAVLAALTGPATTYNPVLTSSSGSPTVGNGVLYGRYWRAGQKLDVEFGLLFGSTTSFGAGIISISLPVGITPVGSTAVGALYLNDSGTNEYPAICIVDTGKIRLVGATGPISATVPFTFTNGDKLRGSISLDVV